MLFSLHMLDVTDGHHYNFSGLEHHLNRKSVLSNTCVATDLPILRPSSTNFKNFL